MSSRFIMNALQPCLHGPIVTQPLFVHGVGFGVQPETADGVFVATQWNWVYAINAQSGAWEWATDLSLDNAGSYLQPPCQWTNGKCGTGWLARGVNSAPVIDAAAKGRVFLATNEYLISYGLCAPEQPCRGPRTPHQPTSGCTGCHSVIDRTAVAPEPSSAAWVLFRVTTREALGALGPVKYIQRVHTHAGHAPNGPPDHMGQLARARFYAQYWLYE